MSFKREGNDYALLKNLQHRRVSEMLGEHIPDDEALLLANGRLTCTVCYHRPIFDTLAMLAVHRKGRKHLYELSNYLLHKRNFQLKKMKQEHKNYLKSGKIVENITKLDDKDSISKLVSSTSNYSSCVKRKQAPAFNKRRIILDIYKDIKVEVQAAQISLQKSETAEVRQYLKSLSRKRPLAKTINKLRENYGNKNMNSSLPITCSEKEFSHSNLGTVSSEKVNEVKYILKMKESGWIKDSEGNWMKDPNVEFDSDDEDPPSFL